jgi:drug/metabolite transporter (DMT)-like permease
MLLLIGAFACVLGAAMGQVLYKAGAIAINDSGTFLAVKPLGILFVAFGLYFVTSIGWVLILKRAPLGQIYPVMALSFVVVPIASYFAFGEQFTSKYIVGVILIFAGIILCLRS